MGSCLDIARKNLLPFRSTANFLNGAKAQTNETNPNQSQIAVASFASVYPKNPGAALRIFYRTGSRLMINGGRMQFLDVTLTLPENVGLIYATSLFWSGSDARINTSHLVAALIGRVDSFIDVGSNIGIYAVYAGVRSPQLSVFALEPIPEIWRKNVAFHRANNLSADRVFNLACGDSDRRNRFFSRSPITRWKKRRPQRCRRIHGRPPVPTRAALT